MNSAQPRREATERCETVQVSPAMTTFTLFFVVVVAFAAGGLSGFLLAALLQMGRDGGNRRPTIDTNALHPLDLPTH
jgi:hypothetical protein